MTERLVHIKSTHMQMNGRGFEEWLDVVSVLTSHIEPAKEMAELTLEYKKGIDPEAYISTETFRTVTWMMNGTRHYTTFEVL